MRLLVRSRLETPGHEQLLPRHFAGMGAKANGEQWYQRYLGGKWFALMRKTRQGSRSVRWLPADVNFCGGLEANSLGKRNDRGVRRCARSKARILAAMRAPICWRLVFSSNDYVGHAVGPDDPAVRDISIRTDRLLGNSSRCLRSAWVRGTSWCFDSRSRCRAAPEVNQSLKLARRRLSDIRLTLSMRDALVKRFGPGEWLLPGTANMQYLNLELIRAKKLDPRRSSAFAPKPHGPSLTSPARYAQSAGARGTAAGYDRTRLHIRLFRTALR